MTLILPDRRFEYPGLFVPGRKPTIPVTIDWSKPMARGLKFAHTGSCFMVAETPNTALTPSYVIKEDSNLRFTNTASAGSSLTAADSSFGKIAGSEITIFVRMLAGSTPDTNYTFIVDKSPTNANDYRFFVYRGSNGGSRFRLKAGGSFTNLDSTTYGAITADTIISSAGTYDGATMKLYRDGILDSSTAKTGAINNGTEILTYYENAFTGSLSGTTQLHALYIFDRSLSAQEIASLDSNPYQFLVPL